MLPFLCICFLLAARAESAPQPGSAQQSGERATATSTATRRLWKDRSSDSSNPTTPLPLLPLPYGHLKQPPSRSCCWRCRRVLGCRKTSLALALTAATAAARQQQWQLGSSGSNGGSGSYQNRLSTHFSGFSLVIPAAVLELFKGCKSKRGLLVCIFGQSRRNFIARKRERVRNILRERESDKASQRESNTAAE